MSCQLIRRREKARKIWAANQLNVVETPNSKVFEAEMR